MKTPRPGWRARDRRQGLTLIELLVVLAVVGILASIALPQLDAQRQAAHFSTLQQDLRNVGMAQEVHYRDHMEYADDPDALITDPSTGVNVEVEEATASGWAASATHETLEDEEGCALYLGGVDPPALPDGSAHEGGEGTVQCTD